MAAYMFQILKMNMLAAATILGVLLLSRLLGKRYSSRWKYWVYLVVAVFLLVPVDFSAVSPVKVPVYEPKQQDVQEMHPTGDMPAIKQWEKAENRSEKSSSKELLEIAFLVWIAGAAVAVFIRILAYQCSIRNMVRWSYPVSDRRVLRRYYKSCRENHVANPPKLMVSSRVSTPVLAGLLHPGLYLTQEPYSLYELQFVFCHELCHYKRKDLWYKMLLLAVSAIYWFNPALYLMKKEAEKDVENLCDTLVVKNYSKQEKNHYNQILLKTAAIQNHVPYLSASLNDGPGIFRKRILYMRNLSFMKEKRSLAAVFAVALVAVNILVGSTDQNVLAEREVTATEREKQEAATEETATTEETTDTETEDGAVLASGIPRAEETIESAQRNQSSQRSETEKETASVEAAKEDYRIESYNAGNWVLADSVNIRSGYGDSGEIIGTVYYADVLDVTGIVLENGIDSGWRRVNYMGMEGYVYGDYISEAAPSAERNGLTLTEESLTLWTMDGTALYVNRATDGRWYDGSGREYVSDGNSWNCVSSGEVFTDQEPYRDDPQSSAVQQVSVWDEGHYNMQTLYQAADGSWQNIAGGSYQDNGDGTWTGPDGTVWYMEY